MTKLESPEHGPWPGGGLEGEGTTRSDLAQKELNGANELSFERSLLHIYQRRKFSLHDHAEFDATVPAAAFFGLVAGDRLVLSMTDR